MLKLSIIIPVLNEAETIVQTLAALASLRGRGAEVIVVNGGSRDGTAERAAPQADRVIVAPRGRALQMNAGAAEARGDILLFLHADTTLPDNADALLFEGLRDPVWQWGRFDVAISGRSLLLPAVAWLMNWRSLATGIATGDQAMFMRRTAFDAVGGFPNLPLMEDIAMSKRLKRLSRPLCLAARVTTSGRRWDRNGAVRTILLMWRLRLTFWLGASPESLARRYGVAPRDG